MNNLPAILTVLYLLVMYFICVKSAPTTADGKNTLFKTMMVAVSLLAVIVHLLAIWSMHYTVLLALYVLTNCYVAVNVTKPMGKWTLIWLKGINYSFYPITLVVFIFFLLE